jgi:hypothetical protein
MQKGQFNLNHIALYLLKRGAHRDKRNVKGEKNLFYFYFPHSDEKINS